MTFLDLHATVAFMKLDRPTGMFVKFNRATWGFLEFDRSALPFLIIDLGHPPPPYTPTLPLCKWSNGHRVLKSTRVLLYFFKRKSHTLFLTCSLLFEIGTMGKINYCFFKTSCNKVINELERQEETLSLAYLRNSCPFWEPP